MDRTANLFRSATLLKLRPPAASWTSFFAASFSFFRDSSKSIYIDRTQSMLCPFWQQWADHARQVLRHRAYGAQVLLFHMAVHSGFASEQTADVDAQCGAALGLTWSFHLVFHMKSEVYLPPLLVKSTWSMPPMGAYTSAVYHRDISIHLPHDPEIPRPSLMTSILAPIDRNQASNQAAVEVSLAALICDDMARRKG